MADHTKLRRKKMIERAAKKSRKLSDKLKRQNQKIELMVQMYNEMYTDDPIILKKNEVK